LLDTVTGINQAAQVGCGNSGEHLGLADTQLALFQVRRKMGCHVADQCCVTDRQHQGQESNSETCDPAHEAILNHFYDSMPTLWNP